MSMLLTLELSKLLLIGNWYPVMFNNINLEVMLLWKALTFGVAWSQAARQWNKQNVHALVGIMLGCFWEALFMNPNKEDGMLRTKYL